MLNNLLREKMDNKKIKFKKASKPDKELIRSWLKKPHLKEYWDNPEEILENFDAYLKGNKTLYEYWICSHDKTPFGLIITSDASKPDPGQKNTPDHIVAWLEPEGMTLLLDFAIGEKTFLGKGFSSETLKKFAESQEPQVTAFLADPEVKNERAIHVYEKAGFVKVATFIRGKGFFKGNPHYLMKMKIPR
jgi:RimJ/RimL family protein N-acetyltransferase